MILWIPCRFCTYTNRTRGLFSPVPLRPVLSYILMSRNLFTEHVWFCENSLIAAAATQKCRNRFFTPFTLLSSPFCLPSAPTFPVYSVAPTRTFVRSVRSFIRIAFDCCMSPLFVVSIKSILCLLYSYPASVSFDF